MQLKAGHQRQYKPENKLYVQCLDCGCHTAELSFRSEEERQEMARRAARSWNLGKVIYPGPGD